MSDGPWVPTKAAAPSDRTAPTVALKKKVKLVLFPGETDRQVTNYANQQVTVTYGHIYIVGGGGESYEVACGPRPGMGSKGLEGGGHTRGVTPKGTYVLDRQEHVVTVNWPMSSIPWGADLVQKADGFVYYTLDGGPEHKVTGPGGGMTQACELYYDRTPQDQRFDTDANGNKTPWPSKAKTVAAWLQGNLHDANGNLITPWNQNDFGKWSWNLTIGGSRSAYFIHTTPDDEAATAAGNTVVLENSHGCVHVRPADRDEMMQKGYLVKGTVFEVKDYGPSGPP